MTSIIKVDNIQDSTGTSAISIDSSGNATFSGTVNASKAAGSYVTLSGSSHTFTNIPSVYNTLTFFLSGVSCSATAEIQVQFGTSGGIVTTGYWNQDSYAGLDGAQLNGTTDTNNNCFTLASWTGASNSFTGYYTFKTAGNDLWVSTGVLTSGTNNYFINQTGYIDLSDTLTQIKIQCASGTFDSGSVNLLYG